MSANHLNRYEAVRRLVAPGAKTYAHFLALSELLEERLGRRAELVTTEALSLFIGPRILAEAQDVLRAA